MAIAAAWEEDTMVNVLSTTKTMVALRALILADHGERDLNAPVAEYWPEFAAGGEQDVRVRHLLGPHGGLRPRAPRRHRRIARRMNPAPP
ncbi:serine hydrolase domain-containing protein [Nocardia abscessus]|uniref:serine hydrolase domain-containing protein n=1 Tax=Nocardia abscessus TaxID=120957 RepID=UPI0002FDF82D